MKLANVHTYHRHAYDRTPHHTLKWVLLIISMGLSILLPHAYGSVKVPGLVIMSEVADQPGHYRNICDGDNVASYDLGYGYYCFPTAAGLNQNNFVLWPHSWDDEISYYEDIFPSYEHAVGANFGIVPTTGIYKLRTYLCNHKTCTIGTADLGTITSTEGSLQTAGEKFGKTNDLHISPNSSNRIIEVHGHQPSISYCIVFVLNDETEIAPSGSATCPDGNHTPPPASFTCTLDKGGDILIPMGTIHRGGLLPTPSADSTVDYNLNVDCTGPGDVTVNSTFTYDLLTANSMGSAASTSVPGLGISMKYNDTLINNGTKIPTVFQSGLNTIKLSLSPVRADNISSSSIPTGEYQSSVTMTIEIP